MISAWNYHIVCCTSGNAIASQTCPVGTDEDGPALVKLRSRKSRHVKHLVESCYFAIPLIKYKGIYTRSDDVTGIWLYGLAAYAIPSSICGLPTDRIYSQSVVNVGEICEPCCVSA